MTGPELQSARKKLKLEAAALGRRLQLPGRDPGRLVRGWEKGATKVPGPVAVAIGYMLAEKQAIEPQGSPPTAIQAPAGVSEPEPISGPVDPLAICSFTVPPKPKTRRRG